MKLTETEKRFIQNLDIAESHYASLPRFSLQEMVEKTTEQRKIINANMDATHPAFDFDEANIYNGLGDEDKTRMVKSLANIPLSRLLYAAAPELGLKLRGIQEFLAKSGNSGIQGAAFLIPDKIHQVLFDSAVEEDIVERISIAVIPPDQIPGATLKVDIAVDDSYGPRKYSTGGMMADDEISTVQATMDFTTPWGINFRIGNDLIEDSQFDMVEFHLRQAGREFGEFATNEALAVLKTATDGDGTVNGGVSGQSAETKFTGGATTDLTTLHRDILQDKFKPSHLILVPHVWYHSLVTTAYIASSTYSEPFAYNAIMDGLPNKLLGCEVIWSSVDTLTVSQTYVNIVSIMFDKRYALLTGRKRWLRIENYSDPVRDLVGATITARQDSVSVYDDSIGVITETT